MPSSAVLLKAKAKHRSIGIVPIISLEYESRIVATAMKSPNKSIMKKDAELILK